MLYILDSSGMKARDRHRSESMSTPPVRRTSADQGLLRELFTRVRDGDRSAFGALYEALFDSLWRLAALLVHSSEAAEEIVQDVFLNLWIRRETLDVDIDIRVYLNEAVRHLAYNVLRHRRVVSATEHVVEQEGMDVPAISQPFVAPDAAAETEEFYAAYNRILATLTRRDAVALRLRWEEGFTFEEMGQILELSAMGARKVILRAQGKVREALADYRSL
jgi:RNA polymerase sigma factor (sigma-70 family)